jgi:protein-S-isoprenylcysteine O-methyltransferase Ste14
VARSRHSLCALPIWRRRPICGLAWPRRGVGNVLALAGICDLGRSFGVIAAHRGIQTCGLYRSVRHPIYAAYLLAFGGFVLTHPSIVNGMVLLVWAGIQTARIHAEEHLLSADPQYTAYTQRVRHRLIPGIW